MNYDDNSKPYYTKHFINILEDSPENIILNSTFYCEFDQRHTIFTFFFLFLFVFFSIQIASSLVLLFLI